MVVSSRLSSRCCALVSLARTRLSATRTAASARFGLWNGTDGLARPAVLGRTFDPSTTHYLASTAAQIDSGDIEDVYRMIRDKGFGLGNGSQLLILAYPDDSEDIQTFRAGK